MKPDQLSPEELPDPGPLPENPDRECHQPKAMIISFPDPCSHTVPFSQDPSVGRRRMSRDRVEVPGAGRIQTRPGGCYD